MIEFIVITIVLAVLALTLYALIIGAPPVPTPKRVAKQILKAANIKKGEIVYDLGCGDGRLVFSAAMAGAKATGFEISPIVFTWAYLNKIIRTSSAKILWRDFLMADISDANTIFLYMYPTTIKLFLKKKFEKQLKPGTKVISFAFEIKNLRLIQKTKADNYPGFIFVYQI